MIKTEDEIIVDLSTSCTKELAVGKLLGWIKGPIFPKVIMVNRDGATLNLLQVLKEFDDSLEVVLTNLREDASLELVDAAEADATFEELKKKEEAVTNIDLLIHNAFMFMSGINEELSKGDDSKIKIDYETSKQTGVSHITLSSVNRWAKKKYGISILDDKGQDLSPEDAEAQPINQNIEEGPYTEITEKNIYTTFGFLIEAFAQTATRFGKDKGKPNIKQISDHIADLAAKASGTDEMDNQSAETIRKRLTKARNIKNSHFQPR